MSNKTNKMNKFYFDKYCEANRKSLLHKSSAFVAHLHVSNLVRRKNGTYKKFQVSLEFICEDELCRVITEMYAGTRPGLKHIDKKARRLAAIAMDHLQPQPSGKDVINAPITTEKALIEIANDNYKEVENFFNKIIYVSLGDIDVTKAEGMVEIAIRRPKNGKHLYATVNPCKRYIDLETGGDITDKFIDNKGKILPDVKLYKMEGNNPSGNKKAIQVAFDVTDGVDWIITLYNELLRGGLTLIKDKEMKLPSMIKTLSRVFGVATPSVRGCKVANYAIVKGALDVSKDFGGYPTDGIAFHTKYLIAGLIKKWTKAEKVEVTTQGEIILTIDGVKYIVDENMGSSFQIRPYTGKGYSVFVSQEIVDSILENYEGKIYVAKGPNDRIAQQLVNSFFKKVTGMKAPREYEDIQVVIIGDPNRVDLIADCLFFKMPFDISRTEHLPILEIPMAKQTTKTNTQMLNKLFAHKGMFSKSMDLVRKLVLRHVYNKVSAYDKERLPEPSPAPYTNEVSFVNNVIKHIAPEMIIDDIALFQSEFKNTLRGISTDLSKMNLELNGGFYRFVPELCSIILGKMCKILEDDEAYLSVKKGIIYKGTDINTRKIKYQVINKTLEEVGKTPTSFYIRKKQVFTEYEVDQLDEMDEYPASSFLMNGEKIEETPEEEFIPTNKPLTAKQLEQRKKILFDKDTNLPILDPTRCGLRIVLQKLPSVENDDIALLKIVDFKEIKRRIISFCKQENISEKRMKAAINFYRFIAPGTIILPRSTFMMMKLAGYDFDVDGAVVVIVQDCIMTAKFGDDEYDVSSLERELYNLFNECILETAVEIKRDMKKATLSEMYDITSPESIRRATIIQQLGGSRHTVGGITNTSGVYNLALMEMYQGEFELTKLLLRRAERYEGCAGLLPKEGKKYVGLTSEHVILADKVLRKTSYLPDRLQKTWQYTEEGKYIVRITDTRVSEIIREAKESKRTKESLIKFFEDLILIFRFYQELNIDSSKNGEKVQIILGFGEKFQTAIKQGFEFNLCSRKDRTYEGEIILKDNAIEYDKRQERNEETYGSRQDDCYKDIVYKNYLPVMKEVKSLLEIYSTGQRKNVATSAYVALGEKEPSACVCDLLRQLYTTIVKNYMTLLDIKNEEMKGLDLTKEEREAMYEPIKRAFEDQREILGNLIRYMLNDYTSVERGSIVKFWDNHRYNNTTGKLEETNATSFSNCIAEDVIPALVDIANKKYSYCDCMGEKFVKVTNIKKYPQENEKVAIENGFNAKYGMAANLPDGEWEYRTFNGEGYLTKRFSEMFTQPTPVNANDVKSIICKFYYKSVNNNKKTNEEINEEYVNEFKKAKEKLINNRVNVSIVTAKRNDKCITLALVGKDNERICLIQSPYLDSPSNRAKEQAQIEKWTQLHLSFKKCRVSAVLDVPNQNGDITTGYFILTKDEDWVAPDKAEEAQDIKIEFSHKTKTQNQKYYEAPSDEEEEDNSDLF